MRPRVTECVHDKFVRHKIHVAERDIGHILGEETDIRRFLEVRAGIDLFAFKDRSYQLAPVLRIFDLL